MNAPTLDSLDSLWLCEAVRLREEHAGPLEDQEANRAARAQGGSMSARVQHRAWRLAERDGLLRAWKHWRQGAGLALALALLLAVGSGASLAFAALGQANVPVNIFWAVLSVLGLNLLMLLVWLGSLVFASDGARAGRSWWWLSAKLARDAQAAQLAPALAIMLQRQRLNRWALGMLTNGVWLLISVSALAVLLALLTTHRYSFVWETTLLSSDTFVTLTQALGALPAGLGFTVPSEAMIRASGTVTPDLASARQAWATWLIGVLVVFGILPRLLLLGFCRWRWQRGTTRLAVPLELPSYALLSERLMPSSERLGVSDPENLLSTIAPDARSTFAAAGAMLVALELDDDQPWPPALSAKVVDAGVLDTRESRQRLLELCSQRPPARLLIACDPRRSPDRGTLSLLGELSRNAQATRVWLLPAPYTQPLDLHRLADWREALQTLRLPFDEVSGLQWLEAGDA